MGWCANHRSYIGSTDLTSRQPGGRPVRLGLTDRAEPTLALVFGRVRRVAEICLGYLLLSDPSGDVRARFGVKRGLALMPTRRQTFVIDTDRRVLAVIKSEIRMNAHADKALEALRKRVS